LNWTAELKCDREGTEDRKCRTLHGLYWLQHDGCVTSADFNWDYFFYYLYWIETRLAEGAYFEIPLFSQRILMWQQSADEGQFQFALTPASEFNWATQNGDATTAIMFPAFVKMYEKPALMTTQSFIYPFKTGMLWNVTQFAYVEGAYVYPEQIVNVEIDDFYGANGEHASFKVSCCLNHDCTQTRVKRVRIENAREEWLVFTTEHTIKYKEHVFTLRIYNPATGQNEWSSDIKYNFHFWSYYYLPW